MDFAICKAEAPPELVLSNLMDGTGKSNNSAESRLLSPDTLLYSPPKAFAKITRSMASPYFFTIGKAELFDFPVPSVRLDNTSSGGASALHIAKSLLHAGDVHSYKGS